MVWQRWVRLLAVLAALGLSAPTLTGCGSDDDDSSTPTEDVIGDVDEDVDEPDAVDPPDTDVAPDTDTDEPVDPTPDPAALRVVHASLDAPAVDVWINGVKSSIQNLAFGEASGAFLQVQPGTYTIAVTAAGAETTDDAVFEADLTLESNTRYTAWAFGSFGDDGDNAFGIDVMTSPASAPVAGSVDLHFGHAAINVGPVWVTAEGSTEPLVAGTDLGETAGPLTLDAAEYALGVALEAGGDPALTFNADLSALSGLVQVFAIGDLDSEEGIELLAVLINGTALRLSPEGEPVDPTEPVAAWRAFHGAFDAPEVAVWIDGTLEEDDIAFGEGTGAFDTVEPGTYTVAVTLAGATDTDEALFSDDLTLEDGQAYTIFAYGSLDADPATFGFAVFATDLDAIGGEIGVAFSHAAEGVGPVSITVGGEFPAVFTDVDLGETEGPADLDADEYTFGVSLDGETIALSFTADLTDLSGLVQLFAVGALESDEGVFVYALLEDGTVVRVDADEEVVPPADGFVRVFHGSFDAPNVDVYVDGTLTVEDLAFGDASGEFLALAPGDYAIAVAGAGADIGDAIFTTTLTVESDVLYTVWAHGSDAGESLGFSVATASADEVESGSFALTFAHAAFNVGEVTILSGETAVFSDVDLGDSDGPTTLPAAEYTLGVSLDGGATTALVFDADLTEADGQVAIFAVGDLEGEDGVYVFALFEDGTTVRIDPTQFAMLRVFHGSYDAPNVDVWANGEVLFSDLAFNTSTGDFLQVRVGEYEVAVTGTGAALESALFETTLTLEAGVAYTVWAYGAFEFDAELEADEGIGFAVITNEPTDLESGSIELTFAHAAPFVGTVDVLSGEATLFSEVSLGEAGTLVVPADSYELIAVAGGGDVQIFFEADLSGAEGIVQVFAVYVSGSDIPVSLAALLNDGTVLPIDASDIIVAPTELAYLRVLHLSSDAGNVDIYVDGELVVDDLALEEASFLLPVELGESVEWEVAVYGAGADPDAEDAVFTGTLDSLEADTIYTVVAYGEVFAPSGSTLDFAVLTQPLVADTETLTLSFSHFADVAPPARVILAGDPETELFAETAFGETAEELAVFSSDVEADIGVELSGIGEAIRFAVDLEVGQFLHILASSSEGELALYVLTEDGLLIPLEFEAADFVRLIHGYEGAPAVDFYVDGELFVEGLEYADVTEFVTFWPGEYFLELTVSGEPETVLWGTGRLFEGGTFVSAVAMEPMFQGEDIEVDFVFEPTLSDRYFGQTFGISAFAETAGWLSGISLETSDLEIYGPVSFGESQTFSFFSDWADLDRGDGIVELIAYDFGFQELDVFEVPLDFLEGEILRVLFVGGFESGLAIFINGASESVIFSIQASQIGF